MPFIIENTILFSAVEWGKEDKLTCDKFKSLLPMGRMSGSTNFTMLLPVEDGPACIVFSLFPERSIEATIGCSQKN